MNCNLLKLVLMGVSIFAMSGCKTGANQSAASSPEQYAPGRATCVLLTLLSRRAYILPTPNRD